MPTADLPTVWVAYSTDERMVIAVAASAERAKAACADDVGDHALTWRNHRRSGFVNDEWDYLVRPFELLLDPDEAGQGAPTNPNTQEQP